MANGGPLVCTSSLDASYHKVSMLRGAVAQLALAEEVLPAVAAPASEIAQTLKLSS
jgi:hypothetical protein